MGSEDSPTPTILPPSDLNQVPSTSTTIKSETMDTTTATTPSQTGVGEEELQALRESEALLKQQYADSQRRERVLVRRLAHKEQEMQDYVIQISELKAAQTPGATQLRNALLDPAVNILIQKLKAELMSTRARLEDTKKELEALKFTPDSTTGKRLMAKCRQLYQENEDLGRMTSNGRLAKLESDLALQKSYSEFVKKSQMELENDLQMLDEDVEGMQTTIIILQQELKAAKDAIADLEKENQQLKQAPPPTTTESSDVVENQQPEQKIVFNGKDVKIEKIDNDMECEQTLSTINTENNGDLINLTSSTATTTTTTTNSSPIIENINKNSVNFCNGDDEADEDASSVATNKRNHDNSTLDGVNNPSSNQIIVINHKKLRRSSPILQKTITSDDGPISDVENLTISNKTVSTNGK